MDTSFRGLACKKRGAFFVPHDYQSYSYDWDDRYDYDRDLDDWFDFDD
jgi:hypothetical protein